MTTHSFKYENKRSQKSQSQISPTNLDKQNKRKKNALAIPRYLDTPKHFIRARKENTIANGYN